VIRCWFQQLRICSGHFRGGRKSEGDIPVADPDVDDPIRIDVSTLTAVKHAEKSPKSRRPSSTAGAAAATAPTAQKLTASKNHTVAISVRPLQDKTTVVGACDKFDASELFS